ncbi:MAG: homogentisate 1,2-dioxygenase [Pyrinomonadaceae bacterium]
MNSTEETKELRYLSGFGNSFATEAVEGALPKGRNSPQKPPMGLYAEQISGTAFTAPRAVNRRTWEYRIRPSVLHEPFEEADTKNWLSEFGKGKTTPNQLRWNALSIPEESTDFIDGINTIAGNGNPAIQAGIGIHIYSANADMNHRYFYNSDGEMLIVPEMNRVRFFTELGILEIEPGEIAVIPRGLKFRVELPNKQARGYVCENFGSMFRLPELGPIGANGLANARDFNTPVAWYEDREEPLMLITKFGGGFFQAKVAYSPLDVVAWHGNYVPYKYDLRLFNTIGSISYDHPDPSIFTVLTAPSAEPGVANCDFAIFPERWLVMEDTFRPPWYHRNFMSEYMGLVYGRYDAKETGFVPGGGSLHNQMTAHGPDFEGFENATNQDMIPQKLSDTLAFMFETRFVIHPSEFSMNCGALQDDYYKCWSALERKFKKVQ